MHALKIENLSVKLPGGPNGQGFYAVRDLNLEIAQGEAFGIIGESGCGKSMTARAIIKLIPRSAQAKVSGKILIGTHEILNYSEKKMRHIRGKVASIVFQDPMTALSPFFSVGFQLEETLKAHANLSRREAHKTSATLLGSVGISQPEKRLNQFPHEFSGGMRQRVVIAMALAHRPELLIADEPTTGLDASTQVEILELLRSLKDQLDDMSRRNIAGIGLKPMSILFISHDFGAVSQLCDKLAVMYAGQIIEQGNTSALLTNPSHHYTKGLVNCLPQWRPKGEYKLEALNGFPPQLGTTHSGCGFFERCPRAQPLCEKTPVSWSLNQDKETMAGFRCHFPLNNNHGKALL